MRFISVVTTSDNLVANLEVFPIFEDQLSEDVVEQAEAFFKVVEQAEEFFKKQVLLLDSNMSDDDIEFFLEEGYANINDVCVTIVWA